ncbi:MAG: ATP-binding protein [Phycisphaerae bacterium]
MAKRRSAKTTLERKSRLLFGLVLLLTVAACLWWPWWHMGPLSRTGDADRAEQAAWAYLQHLHALRFAANPESEKQLRAIRIAEGKTPPELIRLEPAPPGEPQQPPKGLDGIHQEAVGVFLKHPEENALWQTQGNTLRYVQALRCRSACADCHNNYQVGELIGAVSLRLDVEDRRHALFVNRLILTAAGLGIVAVSIAAFYTLFRYMVAKPVKHLKDVTERVSEGDLQVRSEIDTGDELEVLSDALNHMLDGLAKVQADLRAATESRDAKLDDLAKANVALFEANRVKSKFVATMSHELRTPLNSILGFAEILSKADAVRDDPKLARYARNIQSSGQMLLEMINDLLDLAKIEAGRVQVRCEQIAPQDLAEIACNMVRPLLRESDVRLLHEVDPATPRLVTDATKVQQILYNLLSNAVKFTEEGEIRLSVRPVQDGRVAFAVRDTGPGIARDQQLRIFDRFTQLDSSYTRQYRGTGLGLSIVKELTNLLGGTVSVESEVGKGSTFTVVLPVDSSDAEGRTPGQDEAPGPAEHATHTTGTDDTG